MLPAQSDTVRPIHLITRVILAAAALLAAIAGVQLYILTEDTDQYFAWTIGNPLSAAFIGAGYWTGALLLLLCLRERAWANIRIAMAAVTVFVPLMLLTTLLNLDPFHFHSSDRGGQVAAWAWMIVYIVVPFAVIAVFAVQLRLPGGDPPDAAPVPMWVRALLGVNGAVAGAVGLALLLISERIFEYWPWQLTTLTAQAIGTGFLAMTGGSIWFIHENSWIRGRVGTMPYLLVGALHLVSLARFDDWAEWDRAGAWLYVIYMAGVLFGGIYSTIAAWRPAMRHDALIPPVVPHPQ